jgi:hypothetical protein
VKLSLTFRFHESAEKPRNALSVTIHSIPKRFVFSPKRLRKEQENEGSWNLTTGLVFFCTLVNSFMHVVVLQFHLFVGQARKDVIVTSAQEMKRKKNEETKNTFLAKLPN